MGSYLHGMFSGDGFRQAFLKQLGAAPSATSYAAGVEETLDRLAAHLEAHLDVDGCCWRANGARPKIAKTTPCKVGLFAKK